MSKVLVSFCVVSALSSSALAAINKPSINTSSSILEVINLPSENRRMVTRGQDEKYYPGFRALAFDETQSMNVRWRAVMAMAEVRGKAAEPELLQAADNKQWFMRNAALVALAEVAPQQAQILAQKLIKDKALVIRSAAVDVLQKNPAGEVRELLWEELNQNYNFKNGQSLWVRRQIADALASGKALDIETKRFVQLLSDKDPRVQLPAVRALEKLTGVKLAEGNVKQSVLVGMWKDYAKKEKLESSQLF